MALKESEAIVLRTYPLRESDLLVTLFTRLEGKVKGVARAAKKSKRRFGGALEPMTYVRAVYDERERQELVRLDSCEVIESPMTRRSYLRAGDGAGACGRVAGSADAGSRGERCGLPADAGGAGGVARVGAVDAGHLLRTWMTRLMGFLPEFGECAVCGRALNGTRAYWHALADGLVCGDDKRIASSEMSTESRKMRRRCCGHGHRSLLGLNGQRYCARICGSSWCRFWSGILRRRLVTAGMLERI